MPPLQPRRHRFRFRSVWRLPAPPARVYEALERAEEYPRWWPQVREVQRLDEGSGTARIRSVLPYDLAVTGRAGRGDPAAGVLEIAITGDVTGWARWTVTPVLQGGSGAAEASGSGGPDGGTVAVYEQQVDVSKPLLRLLALPARPLLRANHTLMMRAGERGLRRWLSRGLDDR